jgi:hypothetical protein
MTTKTKAVRVGLAFSGSTTIMRMTAMEWPTSKNYLLQSLSGTIQDTQIELEPVQLLCSSPRPCW